MAFLERAYETLRSSMGANEIEALLWKNDHENAMLVFDCEALVGHLCDLFDRIDALHRSFVDKVVSGRILYDEILETKIKGLCIDWQVQAADVMDTVRKHQDAGYTVDNRAELEQRTSKAEESSKLNFDFYALEQIELIKLPVTKLEAFQTPVLQWPE